MLRRHTHPQKGFHQVTTVLVGVDKSDSSMRAVQLALKWATASDQSLLVVHVIPWSPFSFQTPTENEHRHAQRMSEIAAAEEQIIAPMVALAEGSETPVATSVKHGNPSDELLDLAESHDATHLVVGRIGDSGLRVSVFGSVANRLAQHAPIPVTVVP